MKIKNDTKEDLKIYIGNPENFEPEIIADLKSGEKKELPVENFKLLVIKEEKQIKELVINKGKCFNKERIKDLRDKWQQYNMVWGPQKDNISTELYEIIEEIIHRMEEE